MNSDSILINWILENAKSIHLKVESYKWDLPVETGIKDCKVTFTLDGKDFSGRGSGPSEELALLKGFGEAVDRAVFSASNAYSTNGFSAHTSKEDAILLARCEVLERDRFFCHYLTNTHFFETTFNIDSLDISKVLITYLRSIGIVFKLYEMRRTNDCYSFIFVGHGFESSKGFGVTIGMGSHPNPIRAAHSAALEGLRHIVTNLISEPLKVLTKNEFNHLGSWGPEDHMHLCNNSAYGNSIIPFLFNALPESKNIPEKISLSEISYSFLPLPSDLKNAPIFVAQAHSKCLHDLYFGPTLAKRINFERLSNFSGKTIIWNQIQKIPHPVA